MKVDLRQSAVSDQFEYIWFDMESGTQQKGGRIKGGSILEFKSPDKPSREMQYKDWLLYIKLSSRPSGFDGSLQ